MRELDSECPIEQLFRHHVAACKPVDPASPDWFCGFSAAMSLVNDGVSAGCPINRTVILAILLQLMDLRNRVTDENKDRERVN